MLPISKKRLKPAMFRLKPVSKKISYSILLLFSFVILAGSVVNAQGPIQNDYYASGYNILNGTYISGSVPSSVTNVDSDYLIVRSVATDTSVMYNPSGYATKGYTSMVAGSVLNLTSNDGEYMIFNSGGSDTEDYVDNNTSDVDSSADKGSHSNFAAQQNGPDSINDTLLEENTEPDLEYVWISDNNDYVYKLDKSDPGGTEKLSWNSGVSYPFGCEYRIEDGNEYIYIVNYLGALDADTLIKFHANNGTEVAKWDISGYSGNAYGLAWNGSRWFIADGSDGLIYQVDPADPTVYERSFAYLGISVCQGLAWDGSYLWAVDSGTDKVYQIDVYGNIQASWDFTPSNPTGIAYDVSSGHLWVVGSSTQLLYEYYTNGTEVNSWVPPGPSPQGVAYALVQNYNYELDLEVQWTDVDFNEPNESLCIYAGTVSAENIRVDVWNGTGWKNLFTALASGWNNVSVSLYLDSSTFTIRFKGSIETGDTLQDAWNIDAVLLHTWANQHTAEVEFTGSSNTHSWKQLNWTIDSAWTTGSVNVTIQLYNYAQGSYPTSGNGYMAHTSSTTANTDETRSQLIISNPQDFRNDTGNWQIRIKGVKDTDIEFNFKADLIEFKPTHPSQIVSTEFSFSSMTSSTPTQLNFTGVSQFNVSSVTTIVQIWNYSSSTYASSGEGYLTYTSSGVNETRSLSINTSPQFYTSNGSAKVKITGIFATQSPFQQEINQVRLLYSHSEGVIPLDWSLALLYVSPLLFVPLFLLFLKLKKKKPTKPHIGKSPDAFSKSFGITHQLMVGKTILLEVDPKSDYQNALLNFASEARNSGKALLVITGMNSTLYSAISGTESTKFLLTSLKTSRIQQVNEKETILPAADLSVLLNAIERIQKTQEDKTTYLLLDNLSDIILTCGFEKSYRFTRLLLETISSSTTTALFVFNPAAHDPTISSSIRGLFQIHLAYTKHGPKVKTFFGL